mmetsp:Transcript_26281/g.57573  ORF Transcript_26281/g.57573 Transcript_26281/m.57573 type:complete len:203 (+) Transcript_26281:1257-1865(+)
MPMTALVMESPVCSEATLSSRCSTQEETFSGEIYDLSDPSLPFKENNFVGYLSASSNILIRDGPFLFFFLMYFFVPFLPLLLLLSSAPHVSGTKCGTTSLVSSERLLKLVPMTRLTCRYAVSLYSRSQSRASSPTRGSDFSSNATTDFNVLPLLGISMIHGSSSSSRNAMAEFVVPRSIPTPISALREKFGHVRSLKSRHRF